MARSGNKTVVVEVTRRVQAPLYERYVNRRKKFHTHDEKNECQVGDWVRIVASRPLSRQKRWRLQTIIARGAAPPEAAEPSTEV
jgi:small subunit ribosomal protein S17